MKKTYKVKFTRLNKTVEIEEGSSIVTESNNLGLDIPFSCMQGMCTTCMAKIKQGDFGYLEEPDPDTLTSEEIEEGMALLCIATPKSDLIIEDQE